MSASNVSSTHCQHWPLPLNLNPPGPSSVPNRISTTSQNAWQKASQEFYQHSFSVSALMKTRPCRYTFSGGTCHAKSLCTFAHSPSELKIVSVKERTFKKMLCPHRASKDPCFGACDYGHDNQKIIFPGQMSDRVGRSYDELGRLTRVFVYTKETNFADVTLQHNNSHTSHYPHGPMSTQTTALASSQLFQLPPLRFGLAAPINQQHSIANAQFSEIQKPAMNSEAIIEKNKQHAIALALSLQIQEQEEQRYQIEQENRYQMEQNQYRQMLDQENTLKSQQKQLQHTIQQLQQCGWEPTQLIEEEKILQNRIELYRKSLQQQQEVLGNL